MNLVYRRRGGSHCVSSIQQGVCLARTRWRREWLWHAACVIFVAMFLSEKTMQAKPTPDDAANAPASENDHGQPAPPTDDRDLPELPDPAEVGEDG